jgi:hypothetical protein
MQTMQAQMDRIHATQDPEERQRLMDEHMRSMREGMSMMGEMMRGGMGSGGSRTGETGHCAQSDMQCRMQGMQAQQGMTEQRMGMMQMMMEQMMGRMREQPPEAAPQQVPDGQTSESGGAENHDEHH